MEKLTRTYQLNQPQLLWHGLNENWLLKELGDFHWNALCKALNTDSDKLVDSNGNRLYASFVRLTWSGTDINQIKENDILTLENQLSKYSTKMFFSQATGLGKNIKLKAQLMSIFSTRKEEDNNQLSKGEPNNSLQAKNIKTHRKLPTFAKGYIELKNKLKSTISNQNNLYIETYQIDAYDDINGVGLLYFASYPKISDKCERAYVHKNYNLPKDWIQLAGTISRDIYYFANANPNEKLVYELEKFEEKEGIITANCALYRLNDRQLIAKIITKKVLLSGFSLLQVSRKMESETIPKIPTNPLNIPNLSSAIKTKSPENSLTQIIIDFFKTWLDLSDIEPTTRINVLGIESIAFLELSEHLKEQHQINNNPSWFYGADIIADIAKILLRTKNSPIIPNKIKEVSDDIAIVGLSCRFPESPNIHQFWDNIINQKDLIKEVPRERWNWKTVQNQINSNKGGFIEGIDQFDASFFGISPHEAALMDPQQRIMLESVYTALEDAGIRSEDLKETNTSVFIGASGSDYAHLLRNGDANSIEAHLSTSVSPAILANRISYFFDWHGPSQVIDTACSSSLVAIYEAYKFIKENQSEVAVAGGVNVILSPDMNIAYSKAGMLSNDGKCKTFDTGANGYVRSEGIGIVVLKKLSKAKENGDQIYGIIKGGSINHGGKANSLTAPNPIAQKSLLIQAYSSANIDPSRLSYFEAHGTGTPLGDPIEIEALKEAFKEMYRQKGLNMPEIPNCGIGSIKTIIGHLEAAAGVAGLINLLLCLKHNKLIGNPNLSTPNRLINLENTPFYLRKEVSDWPNSIDTKPRIAGISSFGIGGTNAHLVIEEYIPVIDNIANLQTSLLIPVSAKNEERLKVLVKNLIGFLEVNPNLRFEDLAYTLQLGRSEMNLRLAILSNNTIDLIQQLKVFLNQEDQQLFYNNIKNSEVNSLLESEADKAYAKTAVVNKELKKTGRWAV